MKPKPFSALNHFTVPTVISLSLPPSSRRYRPTPTRTLTPAARDKLNLQVAKQNVNLCLAHGSGCGHCPLRTRGSEMPLSGAGCAGAPHSCASAGSGVLPGPHLEGGVTVEATASAA